MNMLLMPRFFILSIWIVGVVYSDPIGAKSRLLTLNFTSMTDESSVFTPLETITGNTTSIYNNTHTGNEIADVRDAHVKNGTITVGNNTDSGDGDNGSDQDSETQGDDMHDDATQDDATHDDEMHDDSMVDDSMAGGDDDFIPDVSPLLNWPDGKCIDNITWIMQDQEMKGPFEVKKYHVCPNRTFEIGLDDVGHCCLEGKYAPFLRLRSFSEFICGDDGSASNNCVISGGDVQVSATDMDYPGETIKGAVFRGFTFQKASFITVLIANEGDVMFDDCIFKV
jgi:hypothetical protein